MAKDLIRIRAMRKEAFPSEMFAEHAWDMLLQLFSALSDNEIVSESDLILRAGATTSFGRRWIMYLVKDSQIEARADCDDVALTADAITRMRTFLDRADAVHSERSNPS